MKKIAIFLIGILVVVTGSGGSISVFAAEETDTMMCDEGNDVREKCGEPNTRGVSEWVYEPGPPQSFTIVFKEGKVVRILESH